MTPKPADIKAIEEAFNLPPNFINNLQCEDDWSLIIKAHAILESACSEMLCHYFGKYELLDIFTNLEMSNRRTGKSAFISALGLLDKKQRRFISELSELRNFLVHNASNVSFSLQQYIDELPSGKQSNFLDGLNVHITKVTHAEREIEGKQFTLEYPQIALWLSLISCLQRIYAEDVAGIKKNEWISDFLAEKRKKGPIHLWDIEQPETISARKIK